MARAKPRDLICCACGLTWAQGCDRPDWTWINPDFIGMTDCARCGRSVCHHCYACPGEASEGSCSVVLCPGCWLLPPATAADYAKHPLASTHGVDYARSVVSGACWRFESPCGQQCAINPLVVWYWQTFGGERIPEEDAALRKRRDHMYWVAAANKPPRAEDAAWLPPWGLALLAAMAKTESDASETAQHDDAQLALALA